MHVAMTFRLACGLVLGFGLVGGCLAQALTVVTDPVLEPVANRIAKNFTTLHGVPVNVQVSPSDGAMRQVQAGKAGMAMVFGAPASPQAGAPALTHQLMGDASLSIIVNGRNPLRQLSLAQLKALYTAVQPDWAQFGGKRQPIVRAPHAAFDTSGLMFDSYVQPTVLLANSNALATLSGEAPAWQTRAGDFPSILYVAIDQFAIGYASSVAVWRAQADGAKVQTLAIDGVEPTPRTVRGGAYALSRPVELVYVRLNNVNARLFHDFLLGAQGQDLLGEAGISVLKTQAQ
jgi:phosphate transport system substrate-binding protein